MQQNDIRGWPSGYKWAMKATLLLMFSLSVGITDAYAENTKLVISGSTSILPIAEDVGAEFAENHPGVDIQVTGGGSIAGVKALISGDTDIAMSSAFLTQQELQAAQQNNVYPVPFRIAYDCIMPVVNRGVPIRNLTRRELKDIYLGLIDNWQQLDGPDLAIKVFSRDVLSGTHKVWHQVIMGGDAVVTKLPLVHSSAEMIEKVTKTRGAIGYIGLSYLNAQVKPIKVNGVMGSTYSLRNHTYALGRPLFLFTNGWPEGSKLDFINFVLDPNEGQKFVEEAGYIPLN